MDGAEAAAGARPVWGVSALLLATADALAARFGAVAVRGELSGFSRAGSGHCYFALKDEAGAAALLRCAMFRRAASMLPFVPADGQKVELRGRLEVYAGRGELQLVVESMQRVGTGTLYEEFLRTKARLEALGLFAAARKRAIAAWPRTLGVITSLQAAALRDVLSALARRSPHVRVVVYPAPVQGADAPPAIVAALEAAARHRAADTLLLVRGGGSLEDLWAFNDERVVRAVVASPIPVVCGVGHETDVTLADLAADLRAPTPTAAAELAAPLQDEALADLAAHQRALARALDRQLRAHAQRLDQLALRLDQPAQRLLAQRERLDAAQERLRHAVARVVQQRRQAAGWLALRLMRGAAVQLQRSRGRLQSSAASLAALDPHRVLQRGYAWIEAEALPGVRGAPITSARTLRAGQRVRAVWADGSARADVVDVEPLPPAE